MADCRTKHSISQPTAAVKSAQRAARFNVLVPVGFDCPDAMPPRYLCVLRTMVTMAGRRIVDADVFDPGLVGLERRRLPDLTFRIGLVDGVYLVYRVEPVPEFTHLLRSSSSLLPQATLLGAL